MTLLFNYAEIERELDSIEHLAAPFLERGHEAVFGVLRSDLENSKTRAGTEVGWGIPEHQPLKTTLSEGEYEIDKKGLDVFADLTSTWAITPVGARGGPRTFAVTGNASTRIRIHARDEDSLDREIAMWRMEIADIKAPGCHFHAQVLGQGDEPPFPHALSIPRLPIFMATPLVALEFVLGELFQTRWAQRAGESGGAADVWSGIQANRWLRTLAWQQELITKRASSPWIALKLAKPKAEMFV